MYYVYAMKPYGIIERWLILNLGIRCAPGALTPLKILCTTEHEIGWAPEPYWTCWKRRKIF
jgi:hypothetical protein